MRISYQSGVLHLPILFISNFLFCAYHAQYLNEFFLFWFPGKYSFGLLPGCDCFVFHLQNSAMSKTGQRQLDLCWGFCPFILLVQHIALSIVQSSLTEQFLNWQCDTAWLTILNCGMYQWTFREVWERETKKWSSMPDFINVKRRKILLLLIVVILLGTDIDIPSSFYSHMIMTVRLMYWRGRTCIGCELVL